jgi:hypothetical protein
MHGHRNLKLRDLCCRKIGRQREKTTVEKEMKGNVTEK